VGGVQGLEGERRDEAGGGGRERHANLEFQFLEGAHELDRLVRGDASGYSQVDPLAIVRGEAQVVGQHVAIMREAFGEVKG